jgi:hypothetical protein
MLNHPELNKLQNLVKKEPHWLDIAGLGLAGLVNTVLTPLDQFLLLSPGTVANGNNLAARSAWLAGHQVQWQSGWLFYFVVTLTFAWSYYALARNLDGPRPWKDLAVGLSLIAAAIDMVGFILNFAALPPLAANYQAASGLERAGSENLLETVDSLAYAFTYVAAFGLYSLAGLLLIRPSFATSSYPRWLAWVGVAEWTCSALTTLLLIISPTFPSVPIFISILFYAPWVWGSMWWLLSLAKK